MNILCATDNAYVPFCGIMLTSLFENNKEDDCNIYILTEGLISQNIEMLNALADVYHQTIHIVQIDRTIFKDCPIRPGDHITLASYYRLVASLVLPQHIDRIIYLDCDILVCGSLMKLWNNNLEDYALAGCLDEAYFEEEKYQRLELDRTYSYFNAGVLVINLNYWRNNNIVNKCFCLISGKSDKLLFHDQDTLNCVLAGRIKYLPFQYNLQTGFLYKNYMFKHYSHVVQRQVWEAIANPIVIHYSGCSKPWHSRHSTHPYSLYFDKYKNLSLWKDLPVPKTHWLFYFNRFYSHLLYGFGLVRQPETYIITKQLL